jgi:hypothetical protein
MAVANSTMNPFVFLFFNVDAFGCRRSHPGRRRHESGQNNQLNHCAPHRNFPLYSRQPQLIAIANTCRRRSLDAVADKTDCSANVASSQAAPGAAAAAASAVAVVAASSRTCIRMNRGRPTDDLQDDVTETAVSLTATSTVVQQLELGEDD